MATPVPLLVPASPPNLSSTATVDMMKRLTSAVMAAEEHRSDVIAFHGEGKPEHSKIAYESVLAITEDINRFSAELLCHFGGATSINMLLISYIKDNALLRSKVNDLVRLNKLSAENISELSSRLDQCVLDGASEQHRLTVELAAQHHAVGKLKLWQETHISSAHREQQA